MWSWEVLLSRPVKRSVLLPDGGGKCVEMCSTSVAERKERGPVLCREPKPHGAEIEQSCHSWRGQDTAELLLAPKQSQRGMHQAGSHHQETAQCLHRAMCQVGDMSDNEPCREMLLLVVVVLCLFILFSLQTMYLNAFFFILNTLNTS